MKKRILLLPIENLRKYLILPPTVLIVIARFQMVNLFIKLLWVTKLNLFAQCIQIECFNKCLENWTLNIFLIFDWKWHSNEQLR